ncbi:hypothetical protein BR93DRAFT_931044 [Coniochaeta sp. PMI_546]|nr:hypothetical protein BR93DRAFT_931044 [Coniochaeta sp. PMI_546]
MLAHQTDAGQPKTPIILVGHSMGGLVIKQAYILGHEDYWTYQPVVRMMKAMFFLATPHLGAESAVTLMRVLSRLPGQETPGFVLDLAPKSMLLESINDRFPRLCDNHEDLQLFSFFETQPMNYGIGRGLIVEKDCAIMGYPTEHKTPLNANHRTVAKYTSPMDPSYIAVRNALAKCIEALRVQTAKSEAILMWKRVSFRPLLIEELRMALELDLGHEVHLTNKELASCCGLGSIERLFKSTDESRRRLWSDGIVKSHVRVTLVCIQYLLDMSKGKARLRDEIQGSNLFGYACEHLFRHLDLLKEGVRPFSSASSTGEVIRMLARFFSADSVLIWIENIAAHSNLRIIYAAPDTISWLLRMHLSLGPDANQLVEEIATLRSWAKDLQRFVWAFSRRLKEAPYTTIRRLIPAFCPPTSIIHQQFRTFSGVRVIGIRENTWGKHPTVIPFELSPTAVAVGPGLIALAYVYKDNGDIIIYDDETLVPIHTLHHCCSLFTVLVFGTNGRYLASSAQTDSEGHEYSIRVWEIKSWSEVYILTLPSRPIAMKLETPVHNFRFRRSNLYVLTESGEIWHFEIEAIINGYINDCHCRRQLFPDAEIHSTRLNIVKAVFCRFRSYVAIVYDGVSGSNAGRVGVYDFGMCGSTLKRLPEILYCDKSVVDLAFGKATFRRDRRFHPDSKSESEHDRVSRKLVVHDRVSRKLVVHGRPRPRPSSRMSYGWLSRMPVIRGHDTLAIAYSDQSLIVYRIDSGTKMSELEGVPISCLESSSGGWGFIGGTVEGEIWEWAADSLVPTFRISDATNRLGPIYAAHTSCGNDIVDVRRFHCRVLYPYSRKANTAVESENPTLITAVSCANAPDFPQLVVFVGKGDGSVHLYRFADGHSEEQLFTQSMGTGIQYVHFDNGLLTVWDYSNMITCRVIKIAQTSRTVVNAPLLQLSVELDPIESQVMASGKHSRALIATAWGKVLSLYRLDNPDTYDPVDYEVKDDDTTKHWASHPSNPDWVISIGRSSVQIRSWRDLSCLTTTQIPNLVQPNGDVLFIKHQYASHDFFVVYSFVAAKYWDKETSSHIQICDYCAIGTETDSILPGPSLSMQPLDLPRVWEVLGIYDRRLVYLSKDFWVCSVSIYIPEDTPTKHFFIPDDWRSAHPELWFRLSTDGSVLVVRHSEIFAFMGGLVTKQSLPVPANDRQSSW